MLVRAALAPSLLLLTAHGFALIAGRHARLVVVRASDLDEGDALLAEAVGALQDLRVAVASERVERARDCYARVADAPTRADREDLARSVDAQVQRLLERTRAARNDALAAQRAATTTDTAGDGLMRDAVFCSGPARLRRRARRRRRRQGKLCATVVGPRNSLGNSTRPSTSSRSAPRATKPGASRSGPSANELLRRGKALVAERISRRGATSTVSSRLYSSRRQLQSPGPVCFKSFPAESIFTPPSPRLR